MKNAGAIIKSRRERVDVLRSERNVRNETERVHGWVGSMYVAGSLFYIGGH